MNHSFFEKIDCIRIPVANLEEGLDFYSKKLGHQVLWKMESAIGLRMADDKSEIVIYDEPEGLEIDFKVKSTDKAVKNFVEAGGELISEPFNIPIGRCALVKDPCGNQYVILDSSKGSFKTDENKKVIGLYKE